MHVVWVTTEASIDPHSGGGLRSIRLVQALAAVVPVDVVAIDSTLDGEEYRRRTGVASAAAIPLAGRSRLRTAAIAGSHRWPLSSTRLYSAGGQTIVRQLVRPDSLVVIEHAHLLPYRVPGLPFVLSLHNVDSVLTRDLRSASALENAWNARMLRRAETMSGHTRDGLVVAVSEIDAEKLGGRVAVVPNGTDLPETVPSLNPDGTVLFVGSMGYPPNSQAVEWWLRDIWPRTVTRKPLTVVGRDARQRDSWPSDCVRVIGEVESVAPYLTEAAVVALPIQSGSGTRLKLLEALAWGRPVVTTTRGAEGIPIKHGSSALVADDPVEFAAGVDRLCTEPDLAASLSRAGRKLAERYAWTHVGRMFVDAVRHHASHRG